MPIPQTPKPIPGHAALFRLYSAEGVLLYLDASPDPGAEWQQLATDRDWWSGVEDAFIQWLPADRAGAALAGAVRAERARFKKVSRVAPIGAMSFPDAARRLIEEELVPGMSAAKLRKIARTDPTWPLTEADLIPLAHGVAVPWEPVATFFRARVQPADPPVRTALYRYFGVHDELLYVGIASDVTRRQEQHAKRSKWWPRAVSRLVQWHDSRQEAEEAEALTIATEHPTFNAVHRAIPPRVITQTRPGSFTVSEIGWRFHLSQNAVRELTFKPGFPRELPPAIDEITGKVRKRFDESEIEDYFALRSGRVRRDPPLEGREPVSRPSE